MMSVDRYVCDAVRVNVYMDLLFSQKTLLVHILNLERADGRFCHVT